MAAKKLPPLRITTSNVTAKVSAIDSTKHMCIPEIKAFHRIRCGTWCFLIEHPPGKKLIYDPGCNKDWKRIPPAWGLVTLVENGVVEEFRIDKNVSEILKEGGMALEDVRRNHLESLAVSGIEFIWSCIGRELIVSAGNRFDHTGDPSTFPSRTKLIVGEGFKANFMPGYPTDPKAHVQDSDFEGREVVEVDFSNTDVRVGRFRAFDYFGDGSFYILDSPGHAIGHVKALARTHASPPSGFIRWDGDSVHHAAEIRPTEYSPLPEHIECRQLPMFNSEIFPGHFFSPILRNGSKTEHILELQNPWKGQVEDKRFGLVYEDPALRDTVRKDEELDAYKDVFTTIAHGWSLKDVLQEWPKDLNSWKENTR